MMNEFHLSDDVLERWRSRQLMPEEILAASDHLASCAACAAKLASHSPEAAAEAVDRVLEDDREELVHLTANELERWIDGAADAVESEIATSHVAVCDLCRAEAEDLRRFAATLRPESAARRWAPWLAAAALTGLAVGVTVYVAATKTHPPPSPVGAREPVAPGTTQATPAIALRDGALTIAVRADGSVAGLPEAWRDEVEAVLRRGELVVPATALAMVRGAEAQRSGAPTLPQDVRLIAPLSRIVLETRPSFSWAGPAEAQYQVEVYDPRFQRVAASGPLRTATWRPERGLPRGETLTWRVTAIRDGVESTFPVPPVPPAVFEIVTADAARELEEARATGSHLINGITLWRAGMLEEAAAEFRAWAAQNPGNETAGSLAASSARGAAEVRGSRP